MEGALTAALLSGIWLEIARRYHITQSEAVGIHEVCTIFSAVAAAPAEFAKTVPLQPSRTSTDSRAKPEISKTTPCFLVLRRSEVRGASCEDTHHT